MTMTTPARRSHQRLLLACTVLLGACDTRSPVDSNPEELAAGTWGGDNTGVIVNQEVAHVHIGCTFGYFAAPVLLDDDGRFNVPGEYLLRAYPVAIGPSLPAQFAGVLRGSVLTFTVAVNDTVQKKLVALGPVTVTFGRDPKMGPCPICRDASGQPMAARLPRASWRSILPER